MTRSGILGYHISIRAAHAMKIAPITEGWNEGERDWSYVRDPTAAIEAWEEREALALPETYRAFMLRYNGGRIYPRLFRTPAALLGMLGPHVPRSDLTCVDPIHDWATVEAHWRGQVYGQGVPPGHLLIAGTPGAIQLLMALITPTSGRICAWCIPPTPGAPAGIARSGHSLRASANSWTVSSMTQSTTTTNAGAGRSTTGWRRNFCVDAISASAMTPTSGIAERVARLRSPAKRVTLRIVELSRPLLRDFALRAR